MGNGEQTNALINLSYKKWNTLRNVEIPCSNFPKISPGQINLFYDKKVM